MRPGPQGDRLPTLGLAAAARTHMSVCLACPPRTADLQRSEATNGATCLWNWVAPSIPFAVEGRPMGSSLPPIADKQTEEALLALAWVWW